MKKQMLIPLLALAAGLAKTPARAAFPPGFDHTMMIVFDGYAGENPLAQFPALVRFNSAASGQMLPGAADLRFTDAAGNELAHEVEAWNPPGETLAWVRVPALDAGTVIYAHWGNMNPDPPEHAPEDTWAADFLLVQHFNEPDGCRTVTNATAAARPAQIANGGHGRVAGVVGTAVDLSENGRNNGLVLDEPLAPGGAWTASVWFNGLLDDGAWRTLLRGNDYHHVIVEEGSNKLGAWMGGFNQAGNATLDPDSEWRLITAVSDGASTAYYVNGKRLGTGPFVNDNAIIGVGFYQGGDQKFADYLDEVRVAGAARDADWARAEYDTVMSPGFALRAVLDASVFTLEARNPGWTGADIIGLAADPGLDALLFYGKTDGLKVSNAWDHVKAPVAAAPTGVLNAALEGLDPGARYYARYAVDDGAGNLTFGEESVAFDTLPPVQPLLGGVAFSFVPSASTASVEVARLNLNSRLVFTFTLPDTTTVVLTNENPVVGANLFPLEGIAHLDTCAWHVLLDSEGGLFDEDSGVFAVGYQYVWIGGAGSKTWNDGDNWSLGRVPNEPAARVLFPDWFDLELDLAGAEGGEVVVGSVTALNPGWDQYKIISTDGTPLVFDNNGAPGVFDIRNTHFEVAAPIVADDGLAIVGGYTLVVTNITWTGGTILEQGHLHFKNDAPATLAGNIRGGPFNNGNGGTFTKDGAGPLTFLGTDSKFGHLSWADGDGLVFKDSVVDTFNPGNPAGLRFPKDNATLLMTNSTFRYAVEQITTNGKNGTDLTLVDSRVEGPGNWVVNIGDWGSRNSLTVDNSVIINSVMVGIGAGSSDNLARIQNGSEVWDGIWVNNAGNGVGVGGGASNNRVEIEGGEGVVSLLDKAYANAVGSGLGATNNVIRVDGRGVPGSALFNAWNTFYVGQNGAHGNRLEVVEGGRVSSGALITGDNAGENRVVITGAGSVFDGVYPAVLSVGAGNATNNTVYVADGGVFQGFSVYQAVVGGSGWGGAGKLLGNRLIVGPDGYAFLNNSVYVGRVYDPGSSVEDSQILVTGAGAFMRGVSNQSFFIGHPVNGATASGNELRVANGGVLYWDTNEWPYHGIYAGSFGDAAAGADSRGNRLVVESCGHIFYACEIFVGDVNGDNIASNNSVTVTTGGVLEANTWVIRADANNTIAAQDGGVLQFYTKTPTITPITHGNISIQDAAIGYAYVNNYFNVYDHLANGFTNIAWSGNNGLRLSGISLADNTAERYTFEPGIDPTHFARLEMVGGETRYQTHWEDDGWLKIGELPGSGASMLCSNTIATVALPFECNGSLDIINATLNLEMEAVVNGEVLLKNGLLTFEKPAEINGEIVIDLDHLPEGGIVLTANQTLAIGAGATVRFIGTPPEEGPRVFITGVTSGRFAYGGGLPKNWRLKHGMGGAGTVGIHWALPDTLFMIR